MPFPKGGQPLTVKGRQDQQPPARTVRSVLGHKARKGCWKIVFGVGHDKEAEFCCGVTSSSGDHEVKRIGTCGGRHGEGRQRASIIIEGVQGERALEATKKRDVNAQTGRRIFTIKIRPFRGLARRACLLSFHLLRGMVI